MRDHVRQARRRRRTTPARGCRTRVSEIPRPKTALPAVDWRWRYQGSGSSTIASAETASAVPIRRRCSGWATAAADERDQDDTDDPDRDGADELGAGERQGERGPEPEPVVAADDHPRGQS